jgi:NAD(P) transhydrogenase
MVLRCTARLLRLLRFQPAADVLAGADDWYANIVWVSGRKRLLLAHARTFAAGRSGNTEGLGLEEVGVTLDPRGRVLVNERFRTSAPGIYAAGDVIGPPALASVSMDQGRHAASNAMRTPYRNIGSTVAPLGVYSLPEVAMIGATEEAAGKGVIVGRAGFAGNARANIAGNTEGLVKLIFRRADRRLLGAHIIGDVAAEMIHVAQAVLHAGGTIDYFVHSTFNVPTWTCAAP